jgi:hypothetical protein
MTDSACCDFVQRQHACSLVLNMCSKFFLASLSADNMSLFCCRDLLFYCMCGCGVPGALYFKILFHPFPLHHDVPKSCSITSLIAKNGVVVVTSSKRRYGADNINTGLRQRRHQHGAAATTDLVATMTAESTWVMR